MIYVDAGTVHAIGPGVILVETQQNSDTTYRLYDYGRPRELHVKQGLEALKEKTSAGKVAAHEDILILTQCFVVERQSSHNTDRELSPQYRESPEGGGPWPSMRIFVAVSGCGVFESQGQEAVSLKAGEAVVVPATVEDFGLRAQWELEFLRVTLPPTGEFLAWAQKQGLLTGMAHLPKSSERG
jgi:mannose-6-phosphate isomerase